MGHILVYIIAGIFWLALAEVFFIWIRKENAERSWILDKVIFLFLSAFFTSIILVIVGLIWEGIKLISQNITLRGIKITFLIIFLLIIYFVANYFVNKHIESKKDVQGN